MITVALAALAWTSTARTAALVISDVSLDEITIVAAGVSSMGAASAGDVSQTQIASQPILRSAAVLENVPGLIVTQHSGEGKANQYFLRAFNLDHGTDLAAEIDDMPINMPTHAHGQGYTDLNFLIPELVADLHYKKGPYFADEGDFATAGTVRIDLVNEAPPGVSMGWGEDGYRRALATGSGPWANGTLLGAAEIYHNDGPFAVPDDYRRLNSLIRYHHGSDRDFWTLTGMAYSGRWSATDQVPERAVTEGSIGRFGSLNPTDGGTTNRFSLSANYGSRSDSSQSQFSAYLVRYRLDLWSTFTYFLKDPALGDQLLQRDDRVVYGIKGSKTWYSDWAGIPVSHLVGVQARVDDIRDVGIFPTDQRRILGTLQDATVLESNGALYAESSLQWRSTLRTVFGLRGDLFDFTVKDKMQSDPQGSDTGNQRASILSPKLSIVLGPWARTTYFINVADGYHSNDARGVTRSAESPGDRPVTPLTRATSAELGMAAKWVPGWTVRVDAFKLKLNSELVFDGDAGVTTPSGATTRTGIEWNNRYQFNSWLSAELNATLSKARFDSPTAPDDLGCAAAAASHPCSNPLGIVGRHIPNSPTNVVDANLTATRDNGWFGALRARHFGSSPLVEDNSATAPAYTTVDLQLGIRRSHQWSATLDVFNLLNTQWNDSAYYYASRLSSEPRAHADYVIHPGVPRTLRAQIQWDF